MLSTQDFPGPDIGDAPSETTVDVVDYRAVGGPLVDATSIAFRIDTFLVGIRLETEVESDANGTEATPVDAASPSPATPALDRQSEQLVNDVAATLVERIEAVQAGEEVSGIDQSLPPLLLPTDQVWPLPGVAAEGYRDASLVLGSLGPATDFADAFRSGYGRTVAPGTGQADLYPEPPFVTVGVSVFDSPDAAMSVLEVADDLPIPGPLPPPQIWEQVATAEIPETDGSSAYRAAFDPGGPVDSARVAFVSGEYFVTVDVQSAASERAALDAAEDLASQQAACLSAGNQCGDLTVPDALDAGAEATPVAGIPTA